MVGPVAQSWRDRKGLIPELIGELWVLVRDPVSTKKSKARELRKQVKVHMDMTNNLSRIPGVHVKGKK